MDTASDKPEGLGANQGEQAQSSPVNATEGSSGLTSVSKPPEKSRKLKRKIAGVFVLFLAIGFSVYANFSVIQGLIGGGKVTPTPVKPVATATPVPTVLPELTIINTPPFSNTRTWLIKLDTAFYSLGGLPKKGEKGRKDVTATMYSYVDDGVYLCRYDDAESVFLEKKADAGWTRLCDKRLPTATPHELHCEPYNTTTGMRIHATFYPITACEEGGVITAGEYRMHATIYTECQVDGKRKGSQCKGIADLVSPRITVSN